MAKGPNEIKDFSEALSTMVSDLKAIFLLNPKLVWGDPSAIALLFANLTVFFGALFAQYAFADVLLIYFSQSIAMLIFHCLKLVLAKGNKLALLKTSVKIFIAAFLGLFLPLLVIIFSVGIPVSSQYAQKGQANLSLVVLNSALFLFAHLLSFIIFKKSISKRRVMVQLDYFMERMFLTIFALISVFFMVPLSYFLVLNPPFIILLKSYFDLKTHCREHKKEILKRLKNRKKS